MGSHHYMLCQVAYVTDRPNGATPDRPNGATHVMPIRVSDVVAYGGVFGLPFQGVFFVGVGGPRAGCVRGPGAQGMRRSIGGWC